MATTHDGVWRRRHLSEKILYEIVIPYRSYYFPIRNGKSDFSFWFSTLVWVSLRVIVMCGSHHAHFIIGEFCLVIFWFFIRLFVYIDLNLFYNCLDMFFLYFSCLLYDLCLKFVSDFSNTIIFKIWTPFYS